MCIDSEAELDFAPWLRLKTSVSVWRPARSGETGGATRLTNTAPRAPPVLPATGEAARTTSATKVHCASKVEKGGGKKTAFFSPFAYCGCFCLILLEDDSSNPRREETEENNFIEPEAPRSPQNPWSRAPKPEPNSPPTPAPGKPPTATEELQKNEVVNTQQMCKPPLPWLFNLDLVLLEMAKVFFSFHSWKRINQG